MTNVVKFVFNGIGFEIKEVDGLYDANDLRKQIQDKRHISVPLRSGDKIPQLGYFKSTVTMEKWTRYLSESAELRYELKVKNGRSGYTLVNKKGLLAYASWLNEDFQFAIDDAFIALTEGRYEDAKQIAGDFVIDKVLVDKGNEKWKWFRQFAYSEFKEINPQYGGNLTRLVVRQSLGVSVVNAVKGKVDDNLIEKLANQNNGAAIHAVIDTIDMLISMIECDLFQKAMKSREGKKECYKSLNGTLSKVNERWSNKK